MPSNLTLKTLSCIRKHDITGSDEPRILLNGKLYWNGVMKKDEHKQVTKPTDPPFEFTDSVRVEFQEATGSHGADGTRIGSIYTLKEKNGPNSPMVFKSAGTEYTLSFTIVPVDSTGT